MLRLTGILTGSALAITALLYVVGVPQFTKPPAPAVAEVLDENSRPAEFVAAAAPPASEPAIDAPIPTPESASSPEPRETNPAPASFEANDSAISSEPLVEAPQATALESKWFAFWSPFRSQIAADGFVSELQRTTGLDYRVVKLKPGVYEVAFEYSDDLDRENKLSRIAAATGFDLSDG